MPDVDFKIVFLIVNIIQLSNKHVLVITSRVTRKKSPWITDNIGYMIKLRDRALLSFKQTKNPATWDYYI